MSKGTWHTKRRWVPIALFRWLLANRFEWFLNPTFSWALTREQR